MKYNWPTVSGQEANIHDSISVQIPWSAFKIATVIQYLQFYTQWEAEKYKEFHHIMLSWRVTASGRLQPVALMMSDRLFLGVKQTVSAYILVLDDSLQRAKRRRSIKKNI